MLNVGIEEELAALLDLKQQWVVAGRPAGGAEALIRRIDGLPGDAPEVCRAFAAEMRANVLGTREKKPEPKMSWTTADEAGAEVSAGEEVVELSALDLSIGTGSRRPTPLLDMLAREIAEFPRTHPRLPVRNRGLNIPGHVEVFIEHGGLVHGGVVQAAGFRIVCKAYRFFEHTYASPRHHRTDVVAGVCEQISDDGRLLARWSTAERLLHRYATTSVVLPKAASMLEDRKTVGFYLSGRHHLDLLTNPKVDGADDGVPDPLHYTGRVLTAGRSKMFSTTSFREAPGPSAAIENALFIGDSSSSPGYVLDTPYLAVCSLGPHANAVLVAMVSAYREAELIAGKGLPRVASFARGAAWRLRMFRAPAPAP